MAAITPEQRDNLLRTWLEWDENPTSRERVIAYEQAVKDIAIPLGMTSTAARVKLANLFALSRNRHEAVDELIGKNATN